MTVLCTRDERRSAGRELANLSNPEYVAWILLDDELHDALAWNAERGRHDAVTVLEAEIARRAAA